MNSDSHSNPSPLAQLVRELRDESTLLIRQELALAKAEMKENISDMGNHATQIAIGGFVGYAGVIVLLIGLGLLASSLLTRAGVDPDLARWLAPAVLGVVVALIGWTMVARAHRAMAQGEAVPRQTLDTMRENKDWAQSKLQQSS